jgi:acetyltransferase-like isoleucine patch superfamily enzyme
MIGPLFWRLADPLLLKFRNRLEHLEELNPSRRDETKLRTVGRISPRALLHRETAMSSLAPVEHLEIGDYTSVRGEIRLLTPAARVRIGHHCYVGPDTHVWAAVSITIGDFVLIAHNVDLIDNNSHSLDWAARREEATDVFERGVELDFAHVGSGAIVVEDDVWIGAKATILKGVRLGRGAVIAANTVVTQDVAPFTLVAGNPMRVLKELPRS